MDLGGRHVSAVSDSRLPAYCTYSTRPAEGPYQERSTRVSSSGEQFMANQRLMVLPPRIRRVYAGLDLSDDEDDVDLSYPQPSKATQRVDHFIDEICNSPQMDEIESETRKIRRDAQAVLQRLSESSKKKPVRLSSVYFPDLTYTATCSSHVPTRPSTASRYSPPRSTGRETSPVSDYTSSSDNFWRRPVRSYSSSSSSSHLRDPVAKVQSEINRKSVYSPDCKKLNDAAPRASGRVKKTNFAPCPDEVRNNINFRAQSAAIRAAADVGLRKSNDYLMP